MSENNYGALMMKSAVGASDDINAIFQPGIYIIPPSNTSSPDATGGVLTVHSGTPIRRTFTSDALICLTSTRNGSTWSSWKGPLSRINPFADIKADGAAAIAEALSNLGLEELVLAGTMTGAFEGIGYLTIPAIIGGTKRTLIVQWGLATGTTGKIAAAYKTVFPNAVLQVICSVADKSSGNGAVTLAVNQADITSLASRTTVTITPSSSDFQGTTTARFISIGY